MSSLQKLPYYTFVSTKPAYTFLIIHCIKHLKHISKKRKRLHNLNIKNKKSLFCTKTDMPMVNH